MKDENYQDVEGGIDTGGVIRKAYGKDEAGGIQPVHPSLREYMTNWQRGLEEQVIGIPMLSPEDKKKATEQVAAIAAEMTRGEPDAFRIQVGLNKLGVWSPQLMEVACATLADPLQQLGFKLERDDWEVRIRN